jgi:hypothetical protein
VAGATTAVAGYRPEGDAGSIVSLSRLKECPLETSTLIPGRCFRIFAHP